MFKSSLRELEKVRTLVFTGLLIAMYVAVELLFSFPISEILIIRFGFVLLCVTGLLFGPSVAVLTGVLCDVLAYIVAPKGAFFPGFTISAGLTGMIYGMFLYKRKKEILPLFVILAVLLKSFLVDLSLNTLWLYIMYQTDLPVLIPARLIKTGITAAVELVLLLPLCVIIQGMRKRLNL